MVSLLMTSLLPLLLRTTIFLSSQSVFNGQGSCWTSTWGSRSCYSSSPPSGDFAKPPVFKSSMVKTETLFAYAMISLHTIWVPFGLSYIGTKIKQSSIFTIWVKQNFAFSFLLLWKKKENFNFILCVRVLVTVK